MTSWSCFELSIEKSDKKRGVYFVRKNIEIFLTELRRSREIYC